MRYAKNAKKYGSNVAQDAATPAAKMAALHQG